MSTLDPDMTELRHQCAKHSHLTRVTRVPDGAPEWTFNGGLLSNTRADYFSITLRESDSGRNLLMMEQQETALVMLLMAEIEGVESVLLSLRSEPGLIGLTNYSTTIQSTPSNYLRKHGGKPTPFIEIAADPGSAGTVRYDGEQFDWGDYYVYKTKRFLIVKLPRPLPATPGHRWVSLAAARRSLLEDHLITNDLRVALTLLTSRDPSIKSAEHVDAPVPDRNVLPTGLGLTAGIQDSRGTRLGFFKTQTQTREVNSWVQPLLVPSATMSITLPWVTTRSGKLYGVERRTQPGLLGRRLWFPAAVPGSAPPPVVTSAEGGRFWRFPIELATPEVSRPSTPAARDVEWMTESQVAALVAAPLETSLELRMAWSLHLGRL